MEQGRENWDVAVACDIHLGEHFRRNPELWNAQLNIDVTAIQETLKSLSGFAPQSLPLLFTVKSEKAMETPDAMGHFYVTRSNKIVQYRPDHLHIDISLENLPTQHSDTSKPNTSLNKSFLKTVGNSNFFISQTAGEMIIAAQNSPDRTVDITERVELIAQARRMGRKAARSLGCFILPEVNRAALKPGEPLPISEGSLLFTSEQLQETAVHELQHAVDKTNPSPHDTWKQRQILMKLYSWRILATLGVFVSSQLAYEKLENAAVDGLSPAVNTLSALAGTMIAIAATGKFADYIGTTEKLDDKYSELSVWEKRAEAAEKTAATHPIMVNIIKRQPISENYVTIR